MVIENNLFDHDSRGYTCQIYQSTGLVFRHNTIVGSRWGCLFRDLSSATPGSGYQVDHNVFVGTDRRGGRLDRGPCGLVGQLRLQRQRRRLCRRLALGPQLGAELGRRDDYVPLGTPAGRRISAINQPFSLWWHAIIVWCALRGSRC